MQCSLQMTSARNFRNVEREALLHVMRPFSHPLPVCDLAAAASVQVPAKRLFPHYKIKNETKTIGFLIYIQKENRVSQIMSKNGWLDDRPDMKVVRIIGGAKLHGGRD